MPRSFPFHSPTKHVQTKTESNKPKSLLSHSASRRYPQARKAAKHLTNPSLSSCLDSCSSFPAPGLTKHHAPQFKSGDLIPPTKQKPKNFPQSNPMPILSLVSSVSQPSLMPKSCSNNKPLSSLPHRHTVSKGKGQADKSLVTPLTRNQRQLKSLRSLKMRQVRKSAQELIPGTAALGRAAG